MAPYYVSDADLADLRHEFGTPHRPTCRVCGVTGDHVPDCPEADDTYGPDDDDACEVCGEHPADCDCAAGPTYDTET